MAGTGYQVWMVMSDWTAWGAHKITAPEGAAFVVPDYRIVGLGRLAGQLPAGRPWGWCCGLCQGRGLGLCRGLFVVFRDAELGSYFPSDDLIHGGELAIFKTGYGGVRNLVFNNNAETVNAVC